ncbi:hypothetical protein C8P68_103444 [Mucilaginibacter yixingensis]|uniref:Short-subunit dehydrogenase n=1 Tax=Mucilaginibacter yixingensis TaxID=1295612 RepID=A0A2T5JBN4_9SPHI|nr:SDR family oxidoreductase [Mucilaginibacter yixingensis]PTQ98281.1 hypothetical protein C8P68_103444 [Mucilaginibacter yixingensis]
MVKSEEYALVTGASSGIGREIALQLAARGYSLLLTSRSIDGLEQLAAQVKERYAVNALCFAADLADPDAVTRLAAWCKEVTSSLAVLINNAGYGLWGNFDQLELRDQQHMLQLNIGAVIGLTHQLLPLLKQQPNAYIMNVASTAAYQSVPTLTVYAATKAFVLNYSRGLRLELEGLNIYVTCLCPGPTATGFAERAGMAALAELADKFNMQPQEVAAAGLKGLFGKKAEVVPGGLNRVSAWGARHLPKSWIEGISAKLYKVKNR